MDNFEDATLFGEVFEGGIAKDLQEFKKSLEVSYGTSPDTQTEYGATRLESLKPTVVEMTPRTKDCKIYNSIEKRTAKGTIEEFVELRDIGQATFYNEGGLPEEFDEDIRRAFTKIKYMGVVAKIPYVAKITKSIANNVNMMTKAKIHSLMRGQNVNILHGDDNLVPIQYEGIFAQYNRKCPNPSQNTIDKRGKRISLKDLNMAGTVIADNYGNSENLKVWMNNQAWKDYHDELMKNDRLIINGQTVSQVSVAVPDFKIGHAAGQIETDIFMRHTGEHYLGNKTGYPCLNRDGNALAASHEKAPQKLDAATCSYSIVDDANTKLDPGTYDYVVIPVNNAGTGIGYEMKGVVVGSGKKVVFDKMSDNGTAFGREATCFDVYRKNSSDTDLKSYRFLTSFKAGLGVTRQDAGEKIPGTGYVWAIDWDMEQVLSYLQLLPISKDPLARIEDSFRWLVKEYSAPVLYDASKMVLFTNVGGLENTEAA